MSLNSRLTKLEALNFKGDGRQFRDTLLSKLETCASRITQDIELSSASPIEVASYLMFYDDLRPDVMDYARALSRGTGPVAKLFHIILNYRGVKLK